MLLRIVQGLGSLSVGLGGVGRLVGCFICLVKFCYYFFIKEYHCDCSLFLLIELLQLLLALMTLLLCKSICLLLMLQDFTFLFQER